MRRSGDRKRRKNRPGKTGAGCRRRDKDRKWSEETKTDVENVRKVTEIETKDGRGTDREGESMRLFLDASSHFYMRVGPSVRRSNGWYPVLLDVNNGNFFHENYQGVQI